MDPLNSMNLHPNFESTNWFALLSLRDIGCCLLELLHHPQMLGIAINSELIGGQIGSFPSGIFGENKNKLSSQVSPPFATHLSYNLNKCSVEDHVNCSRPTYGYSLPARSPRHITSARFAEMFQESQIITNHTCGIYIYIRIYNLHLRWILMENVGNAHHTF